MVLRHVAVLFLLSLPLAARGQTPTEQWDYSNVAGMPESWGSLQISVNNQVKTPDGQPSLDCVPTYSRDEMQWEAHVCYPARVSLVKNARTAEVTFWVKGDAGFHISMRITGSSGFHYSETRTYPLTGDWQKIDFKEALQGPLGGKWLSAPRLLLDDAKAGQHLFIGPVAFTAAD